MTAPTTPDALADVLTIAEGHAAALRDVLATATASPVLRLHHLADDLAALDATLAEAHAAAVTLATGVPLATFPSGDTCPEHPTPRQVRYLADLARPRLVHDDHLRPSRPCTSRRTDGAPCAGRALAYVDDAVCSAHASPEVRDVNRERRERHYVELAAHDDLDRLPAAPAPVATGPDRPNLRMIRGGAA